MSEIKYSYRISGLTFHSSIPFSELESSDETPFFVLQREERPQPEETALTYHEWRFPGGQLWCRFARISEGIVVEFAGLARFLIHSGGTLVTACPALGLPDQTLRHLFLNQLVPLLLSYHSFFVVHASAVLLDGQATLFCGPSGAGKSTLALSLAAAGHPFLADDGVRLESAGTHVVAIPSFPSLRLYPDSMEALQPAAPGLPTAHYAAKLRVAAGEQLVFHSAPAPLSHVYFVDPTPSESVQIQPLRHLDALMELVRHSFILDVHDQGFLRRQFQGLTAIAQLARYARLSYPRGYDRIPELHEALTRFRHSE